MYKVLLCLRYLRTRYIALASIVSVTLGVATMIVVNSVMAGFSTEMRSRIHGILADVILETVSLDGQQDAEKHLAMVRKVAGEYIEGMTATVEVYGMLSFQYAGQWITRPVTLIGIKPEGKANVGPLVDYLDSYNPVTDTDLKTSRKIVIRDPLRSRDVAPGWELTDEAMSYREEWTRRQRWMLEHLYPDNVPGDEGFDPLKQFELENNKAEQPARKHEPAMEAEQLPPAPERLLVTDNAAQPTAEKDDEFVPPGLERLEAPVQSAAEENPAALLEGRLYVGAGLIQFLFEEQETGKTKTMHMVRPGDDVKISTVTAGRPPNAVHFNATVVDVFKSGMSEYDSSLVFCNLEYLQKVRGMFDPSTGKIDPKTGEIDPETCVRSITSIQIKLKDFNDAGLVVERLRSTFPPGIYSVKTWEQKQGPLLAAVEVESAILNVLLFLIITVAGFGILAIFYMIVVEKTRDIGILKALGASSRGVMSIFLSYGFGLGIVGSGVGVSVGLLFVRYINEIEGGITWLTGRKVFDEKIYYFPEIPTDVHPMMVFWVALGAIAIAVLASILPARRAARLHPVEALRYE